MTSALITGGSRGLGRALAVALARAGWDVTISGREAVALDEVSSEAGTDVKRVVGNVRDDAHRAVLAEAAGERLDLLVNNASFLGPSPLRAIADYEPEDLHTVFDTNVVSPLALTGLLLPALSRQGGTVVNVSSDAGVEVYEKWGPYGASKAALDHASAVLAAENPHIRVYAFDPGDMRTAMHQAAFPGEDISDRPLPDTVVPALLRLVESHPPSGRYVAAELLAESAL